MFRFSSSGSKTNFQAMDLTAQCNVFQQYLQYLFSGNWDKNTAFGLEAARKMVFLLSVILLFNNNEGKTHPVVSILRLVNSFTGSE